MHDPDCQCQKSKTKRSLIELYGSEKWPRLLLIPPPIALVSRQFHAKALPLFYKLNIFDILVEGSLCDVRTFKWLKQRPPELLKYMQCDVVFASFDHQTLHFRTSGGRPDIPHILVQQTNRSKCEEKLEGLVSETDLSVVRREWRRGSKKLLCTICVQPSREFTWRKPHICRLTF